MIFFLHKSVEQLKELGQVISISWAKYVYPQFQYWVLAGQCFLSHLQSNWKNISQKFAWSQLNCHWFTPKNRAWTQKQTTSYMFKVTQGVQTAWYDAQLMLRSMFLSSLVQTFSLLALSVHNSSWMLVWNRNWPFEYVFSCWFHAYWHRPVYLEQVRLAGNDHKMNHHQLISIRSFSFWLLATLSAIFSLQIKQLEYSYRHLRILCRIKFFYFYIRLHCHLFPLYSLQRHYSTLFVNSFLFPFPSVFRFSIQ